MKRNVKREKGEEKSRNRHSDDETAGWIPHWETSTVDLNNHCIDISPIPGCDVNDFIFSIVYLLYKSGVEMVNIFAGINYMHLPFHFRLSSHISG